MKLYYSPGACSLAPHIVMHEAGVPFSPELVNLKTHEVKSGSYYKVNPKGQVPALELDNGQVLTEAAVVIQYIADQKPESGMLPKAGTQERYRAQEWLNYVATEMHKGYGPLWYPQTPDAYKTMVKEGLAKKLNFLNEHFKTNQFLMGQNFSAADAYLFTVLRWSKYLHVDLSPFHEVLGYMERVTSRPKVREALKAEGLLKE